MGEFNWDDHYIYYCGYESLRRNGIALIVNKSLKFSTWMQPQKQQNDLGSFSRYTIQHHSNPSLCPNHWCPRSWNWLVVWRPTRPSRSNTKKEKDDHFVIGDWNAKVGSQEIPGVTGVQNEAKQRLTRVLPRERTDHSKHPLPTTQEITLHKDITNVQYQNQIDYILCSRRWRSAIQSAKTGPKGDFPVVQGLGLWAPNAGVPGLIPGRGTRSHIPQLGTSTARKNKTKTRTWSWLWLRSWALYCKIQA